jgi:hypothetical protein
LIISRHKREIGIEKAGRTREREIEGLYGIAKGGQG